MKRKIILGSLVVAVAACVCSLAACGVHESDETKKPSFSPPPTQGLEYELIGGTEYAVSGIGTATETKIVIPEEYHGLPVTMIQTGAFFGCNELISVTIPDSITEIGQMAFENCTGLMEIVIGDHITNIMPVAFHNTGYYNDEQNWENGALYLENYLIEVRQNVAGSYTIKEGIKCIAGSAFNRCMELTEVILPDSLTSIGELAFQTCTGLTGMVIPDSVTNIGIYAFSGCSGLTSVNIPGSVTSIERGLFLNCSALKTVTIGNGVTSIGDQAFGGCGELTNIVLPDSIINIGDGAFMMTGYYLDKQNWENGALYLGKCLIGAEMDLIGTYSIKDGTICIAAGAFQNCDDLEGVTIPNSVTSIGIYAFYGCSGLTSITIPDSVTSIGAGAFSGCSGLTSITIPDSVTSIESELFYNCSALKTVTIGNGVTSIGMGAFSGCSGLTSIIIPDSVTSIGYYAFQNCSGLTSVTVESTNPVYHSAGNCLIETASKTLILGCNTSVIPSDGSVTSIGSSAFSGCSGLTSITIPDSVTSIGSSAFSGCSRLTGITISDNVTSIGETAFAGTAYYSNSSNWENHVLYLGKYLITASTEISGDYTIKSGTVVIADGSFENCSRLSGVIIPDSVTTIGNSAFKGCSGLTSVTIGDGVTSIGDDAFFGCRELTSIAIPDSVTSIGGRAFTACINLASVTIGSDVAYIGYYAFFECLFLENVYYHGTEVEWESISIIDFNYDALSSATVYYYSESDPFEGEGAVTEGNYWHYADDGVTVVVWTKESA